MARDVSYVHLSDSYVLDKKFCIWYFLPINNIPYQFIGKDAMKHPSSNQTALVRTGTMVDMPEALGQSEAFLDFQERLSRVAPINRPVLLMGERGTGKELAAARLHFLSKRWQGPMVALNCSALNPNLIEAAVTPKTKTASTPGAHFYLYKKMLVSGGRTLAQIHIYYLARKVPHGRTGNSSLKCRWNYAIVVHSGNHTHPLISNSGA